MGVRDQIHETDEYQAQVQQDQESGSQPAVDAAGSMGQDGNTVGNALGPVLSWEKTDVEFWMQAVQVVLLYLILRELRGGA